MTKFTMKRLGCKSFKTHRSEDQMEIRRFSGAHIYCSYSVVTLQFLAGDAMCPSGNLNEATSKRNSEMVVNAATITKTAHALTSPTGKDGIHLHVVFP